MLLCIMLAVGMMPVMSMTAFADDGATTINTFGVTGIAPIYDGSLVTENIHQQAHTAGADYTKYSLLGVVWYDDEARQEENEFTGTFQAGKKYYVEAYFKALDGYAFADRAALTPEWYGPSDIKMIEYDVTSGNSRAYMAFELTCIDIVDSIDISLEGYGMCKRAEDISITFKSGPEGGAFLRGSGAYGDSYYIMNVRHEDVTGPLQAGEEYLLKIKYDVADGFTDDGLKKDAVMLNGETSADSVYTDAYFASPSIEFKLPILSESDPTAHDYKAVVTSKATPGNNGTIVNECSGCGDIKSVEAISYPKTIKLSTTSYTYSGSVKKPTVKVYDAKGKVISSANYTVSYASGRKNVGRYKVTVKFKGSKYSGTKYTYFYINPKGTSISSVSGAAKAFTVKWNKQSAKMATSRITGYQVRYSTSSKMTSPKTKTVKGYASTSSKITNLKAKKTYYVQVRTYKTVNGRNYYSSWSKVRSVKTK